MYHGAGENVISGTHTNTGEMRHDRKLSTTNHAADLSHSWLLDLSVDGDILHLVPLQSHFPFTFSPDGHWINLASGAKFYRDGVVVVILIKPTFSLLLLQCLSVDLSLTDVLKDGCGDSLLKNEFGYCLDG